MRSNLSLRIADKEFKVTCDAEEKALLIDAAQMVDQKMAAIKKHGKTVGSDRIAVMVALNLASDLLSQSKNSQTSQQNNDALLTDILQRIESTIDEFKQIQH